MVLALAASLSAQTYGNGQDGALAPTSDITLDTTANGGVFQFTSIAIPAGVTVHLRGSNAARLLCTGGVSIAGTLEGDADPSLRGGPGGYDGSASSYWLPPLPGGGPALNRTGIGGDGLPRHMRRPAPSVPLLARSPTAQRCRSTCRAAAAAAGRRPRS